MFAGIPAANRAFHAALTTATAAPGTKLSNPPSAVDAQNADVAADAPLAVVEGRDPKGLYRKARQLNIPRVRAR